jgi:type III restriction enzyme
VSVTVAMGTTAHDQYAGKIGAALLDHLTNANHEANPELMRLALKLATGAGKTTVMAMLIAWQTINAVRRPNSKTSHAVF